MKIKITAENSNERLDKFLVNKLKNLSRSQIQKQIKNNLILVNDKKVAAHYFLKEADVVTIKKIEPFSKLVTNNNLLKKIKIIEDNKDYLIIYKPAGLLTCPDNVHNETTLLDWAVEKYPDAKIVHRLDRGVCGLLIIAKNIKNYNYFKNLFKNKKIKKIYHALVHGEIKPNEGIINRPIIRSKKTGIMISKSTIDPKAKPSVTEFEVLKRYKNYTLLKVNLKTGRTHQIRVHLKSIGHSIISDTLYKTKNIKNKNNFNLDRIFLCSTELSFKDLENNPQEFKIKLPLKLSFILKNLQPLT